MRAAFIDELTAAAQRDERIVLLTGDLGYSVFENFAGKFPKRFYNVGIMEQNLMGVAAGLALCGKKAIAYSIATFATMRPFEQIRLDIGFQQANVVVVGVGAGLAYGSHGVTHHATEDVAVMRCIPGMVVLCPGDPVEARLATRAAIEHNGPVYLRLGKGKEPIVHTTPPERIVIGKAIMMQDGGEATIIASGDALPVATAAAKQLAESGTLVRLLSMPCVKPLDADAVLAAARETKRIITVEEHNTIGGLGSAVAETLASAGAGVPLTRIGVQDTFFHVAGKQDYLRKEAGITAEAIIAAVKRDQNA